MRRTKAPGPICCGRCPHAPHVTETTTARGHVYRRAAVCPECQCPGWSRGRRSRGYVPQPGYLAALLQQTATHGADGTPCSDFDKPPECSPWRPADVIMARFQIGEQVGRALRWCRHANYTVGAAGPTTVVFRAPIAIVDAWGREIVGREPGWIIQPFPLVADGDGNDDGRT
jgi:hypothetical protein